MKKSQRSADSPELNPRVPIVATTASAMTGDREKRLEAGMDHYSGKPVEPQDVAAALKRWMDDDISVNDNDR